MVFFDEPKDSKYEQYEGDERYPQAEPYYMYPFDVPLSYPFSLAPQLFLYILHIVHYITDIINFALLFFLKVCMQLKNM